MNKISCPLCGAKLVITYPPSFYFGSAQVKCECGYLLYVPADSAEEARIELIKQVNKDAEKV